jgi:hypothetical protein
MKKHNLFLIYKKYPEEELEGNINLFNEQDWNYISYYQDLSEDFIEKHLDEVDWDNISFNQKLSESFIKKHINKINFTLLMRNKKIL